MEEEQLRLGSLSQPAFGGREGSRAEGKTCPVGTGQGLAIQARTARTARPGRCQAASGRIEKASQAAAGLCMPHPQNKHPHWQPLPKEGKGIPRPPPPDRPSLRPQGLSAETLRHRGLVERPVELDEPPLSLCPADVQEGLQMRGDKVGRVDVRGGCPGWGPCPAGRPSCLEDAPGLAVAAAFLHLHLW